MDFTTLTGVDYVAGRDDCYGTIRSGFKQAYDIHLTNYARPENFAIEGLDLINKFVLDEGFEIVETSLSRLEIGDVLLMRIGRKVMTVNHLALYIGNNQILHHVYMKKSAIHDLESKWKQCVMTVVRHPDVALKNVGTPTTVDLFELMPPHVRFKHSQEAE